MLLLMKMPRRILYFSASTVETKWVKRHVMNRHRGCMSLASTVRNFEGSWAQTDTRDRIA